MEQLRRILSVDGRRFGDGDEFWVGKTEQDDSDEQVIWIQSDDVPYQEFLTFEELMQAKLFQRKSMYEVWNDLVFLSIEGGAARLLV